MKTDLPVIEIPVRRIMTSNLQTICAGDSIREAVTIMLDTRLTTVPVVNAANHCIGILSQSDLTEQFLQEDTELERVADTSGVSMSWLDRTLDTCGERRVSESMTYDVATIQDDEPVSKVCRIMFENRVHHVPVVDSERKVCGIVSTFDIVRLLAQPDDGESAAG